MNKEYSSLVYEHEIIPEPEQPKNQSKQSWIAILFIFIAVGIVVLVSFLINEYHKNDTVTKETEQIEEKIAVSIFDTVDIDAKAYVVMDMNTGKIISSKNENVQLPLASLSKIMTAIVVAENLDQSETVTIKEKDLVWDGDNGLVAGERWSAKDLVEFMLVVSSNDGSSALASAVESVSTNEENNTSPVFFSDLMNKKARELNLTQSYFINSSGLDIDERSQSGSYGSALDIAKLFSYALKNHKDIFEATEESNAGFTSKDNIFHNINNTNIIVNEIPGLFASKTGFTDLAGGNLIVAFDAGMMQPYIIAVLGASKDGRFEDMLKLHNAVRKYINVEIDNTQ